MWTLQKLSVIEVEKVGIALSGSIQPEDCPSESSDYLSREEWCIDIAKGLHIVKSLTYKESDDFRCGCLYSHKYLGIVNIYARFFLHKRLDSVAQGDIYASVCSATYYNIAMSVVYLIECESSLIAHL